jgi:hypothetical protein
MKSDNFYFKLPVTHIITISKQDKILDLELFFLLLVKVLFQLRRYSQSDILTRHKLFGKLDLISVSMEEIITSLLKYCKMQNLTKNQSDYRINIG